MTKAQRTEQAAAIERLREWVKPGDTVYTILRHVSRSGMSRSISTVIDGEEGPNDISYMVARALGNRMDRDRGGVIVGGAGMDMGFHLVYNLSYCLWPNGFECVGAGDESKHWTRTGCPSNDHSNQRELPMVAGSMVHSDGGYALRHRWL